MSDPARLVVGLPYNKKHGKVPGLERTLKEIEEDVEYTKARIAELVKKLSKMRTSGKSTRELIERLKKLQKEDENEIATYKKGKFGVFDKEPFEWIPTGSETDDEDDEGYESGLTGIIIFEVWEEAVEMTPAIERKVTAAKKLFMETLGQQPKVYFVGQQA